MPRHDFDDATIAHQDYGTGLDPEADRGPISAAFLAASGDPTADRIVAGLEPDVDWDASEHGTLSLTAGVATLSYDGDVTVQSEPGGADSYDREWHGPIAFPVSVPAVDALELEAGENDVYLAIDPAEIDAASIVYGADVAEPDGPALKRAVVDTDAESIDVRGDGAGFVSDRDGGSAAGYEIDEVENAFGETHVAFRFGSEDD